MTNDFHLTNEMIIHTLLIVSLMTTLLTALLGELRTLKVLAVAAAVAISVGYLRLPDQMSDVFFHVAVDSVLILPSLALAIGVGKLVRFGVRRMQRY